VVFELLGYLVPHYLGIAMPAALFLGLLFGVNRLSKNSEIDAMLAAGISLHRMMRPVIWLTVLMALIAVFIFGWMQPYTRYAYRALIYTVSNVEVFYLAEEGVFMQAGTRTFILDKLERKTNRFQKIFLFDYRGKGGAETITAKRGYLVPQKNDPRPLLVLEDGHRLELKSWPEIDSNKPLPQFNSGFFKRAEAPIGKESATVFRPRGQDERELTFTELIRDYNTPHQWAKPREIHAELHKRIVSVLTILILPFLALPFAVGQRRQQRAYRFAVALIILVGYYELVQQGAAMANVGAAPIWLTIWTPFILLTVFSLWRYVRVCFTLREDLFDSFYDQLARGGQKLKGMFRRIFMRRGGQEARG
jgi:lipopolysaccharide export system permease protein